MNKVNPEISYTDSQHATREPHQTPPPQPFPFWAYYYASGKLLDAHPVNLYPVDRIELPPTWSDTLEGKPDYLKTEPGRMPPDIDIHGFRTMVVYYYALVTHIDNEVGRLVDHIRELGLMENTILAFMSDHGEMLGDHHAIQKRLFFEGSARVPCLLSWPVGLPGGHRVSTPLGGVDLAPTLLELAGLSFENPIDGRSVASAIATGRQPEPMPIFSEIGTSAGINIRSTEPEDLAARVMIRQDGWKYIWNRTDRDELYNLNADPDEMTNLAQASEQADRIARMRTRICDMIQHTGPGSYSWCLSDRQS